MRMFVEIFLNLKLMIIMISVVKVSDEVYWCLVIDMLICIYFNKELRFFFIYRFIIVVFCLLYIVYL